MGMAAIVDPEDELRARFYRLLARLLEGPADQPLLDVAAGLKGDETPLGAGIRTLAAHAMRATPAAVAEEYFELFVGIGRGELVPYASYYLTGFLNERPLARLRGEMAELGIARAAGVTEPEDHIAALCQMMAGLIEGSFDAPAGLAVQRRFFEHHMAAWAPRFFTDSRPRARPCCTRRSARSARAFMAIERTAFAMVE